MKRVDEAYQEVNYRELISPRCCDTCLYRRYEPDVGLAFCEVIGGVVSNTAVCDKYELPF